MIDDAYEAMNKEIGFSDERDDCIKMDIILVKRNDQNGFSNCFDVDLYESCKMTVLIDHTPLVVTYGLHGGMSSIICILPRRGCILRIG